MHRSHIKRRRREPFFPLSYPFSKAWARPPDGPHVCLTWGPLVPQELPLALPLAPAGAVPGLSTAALFVLVVEAAGVEVPRALPDGEQVAGCFALVDAELARRVFDALPLLQKPTRKAAYGPRSGRVSPRTAAFASRRAGDPAKGERVGSGQRLSDPAIGLLAVLVPSLIAGKHR